MRFFCKYPGYKITLQSAYVDGSRSFVGRHVEFNRDGFYETDDPKEIEAIKKSSAFGVHIHSDEAVKTVALTTPPDPDNEGDEDPYPQEDDDLTCPYPDCDKGPFKNTKARDMHKRWHRKKEADDS